MGHIKSKFLTLVIFVSAFAGIFFVMFTESCIAVNQANVSFLGEPKYREISSIIKNDKLIGKTFQINVTLHNSGDLRSDELTVNLTDEEGYILTRNKIYLDPDETQTISFTWSTTNFRNQNIKINFYPSNLDTIWNGFNSGSKITQLAILLTTIAGSGDIDLTQAYISLSDTTKHVILNYSTSSFSSNISNGLFDTLDSSMLTSTTYGIMVVRDIDSSCTSTTPTINSDDLVVLLVNTTKCFAGINTRTDVAGYIVPEYGINGVISFTTPSTYINTIIELQT